MITTTLEQIKDTTPNAEAWSKVRNALGKRKPLRTVIRLQEAIPLLDTGDVIRLLAACPDAAREIRLFACACACHVLGNVDDVRVLRAIETSACFAEGLADCIDLREACIDVSSAARDHGWNTAYAAAFSAAKSVDYVAALDASDASAGHFTHDSTLDSDAERKWQAEELARMCAGTGIYAPIEG